MYKTLIVDDEPAQQDLLKGMLLKNFPQFELMEICNSVDEGLAKIKSLHPQLVFLDVVMPPKTGFDLLSDLKEIDFEVIFTTSFEQYAIKAFKVSAVDYLLKPFGLNELRCALEKFEQQFSMKHSLEHIQSLLHNISLNTSDKIKIALPTLNGFVFVQVNDIVRCESDNTYTTFFFADKRTLVTSKTIKDCEELLCDYNFFRIHNSHLINMRYIREYIKGDGGQVKMTDGSMVDVSRRKKDEFVHLLKKL